MASSSDEDAAIVGIVCSVVHELTEQQKNQGKRKRKERSHWVRPWLKRRPETGAYSKLLRELAIEDPMCFRHFLRMDVERFHKLLEMVGPIIEVSTKQFLQLLVLIFNLPYWKKAIMNENV